MFGSAQLMTAGDSPAAIVLDLVVEPTINLSAMRGRLATALHDLGEDHLYDVVLVVTELVSNVLDHTPGTGRLRVFRHTTRCEITIEVDDRSPARPVHGHSRLGGTRGRGIVVVDNVAREWGIRPLPDGGKTVFASVPCPDAVN
ncbi:ATP-binding protein [Lentzea rhizosphaerae]|uniref:ATP-binding protein n=1 Tax=Lentzea rhizosphaerae TaxID=2041025 RepID=A0ABV8C4X7_9PSEU